MPAGELNIWIDGASRGNPGPAGYGVVIAQDGVTLAELSRPIGHTTNNVAEYAALTAALDEAARLGARRLIVRSDSELLVRQMNGEYRVKNRRLASYYGRAQRCIAGFDAVNIRLVPREENAAADRLARASVAKKKGSKGAASGAE